MSCSYTSADGDTDLSKKVVSEAEKLRELFLSKHAGDIEKGHYDDRDVDKFRSDDSYVASFIRSYETLQDAANRLHESLRFRLEFGVNDLTHDSFPLEFWERGACYYHNHDKDGHKILYLCVKLHKKDPQLLPIEKRFFAYMLETHYIQDPDDPIVLLFDLSGTGLSHLDMDFIKFIINSFKVYYPKILSYMLMYEMPWLFNAAWKIIKTWLSAEAIARIKFVTKSDIQEYINKDQLFEHMGGTDKYQYKYEPNSNVIESSGIAELDTEGSAALRKRVTFADQEGSVYRSFSSDSLKEGDTNNSNPGPTKQKNSILGRTRSSLPASSGMRENQEDNSFIGRLLTISPAEDLMFVIEEGAKESTDTIVLKNTLPYSIAYKVKTTSPEKYRVRPSSGMIRAGSQVEVVITLQQGYQNTVHKDKFLIMAMEVANESGENVVELWKSAQKESIMEHRLRCSVTSSHDNSLSGRGSSAGNKSPVLEDLSKKVDTLIECNRNLNRSVQMMLGLQCAFLILLLVFACLYLFYPSDSNSAEAGWRECEREQQKPL